MGVGATRRQTMVGASRDCKPWPSGKVTKFRTVIGGGSPAATQPPMEAGCPYPARPRYGVGFPSSRKVSERRVRTRTGLPLLTGGLKAHC